MTYLYISLALLYIRGAVLSDVQGERSKIHSKETNGYIADTDRKHCCLNGFIAHYQTSMMHEQPPQLGRTFDYKAQSNHPATWADIRMIEV